MVLNGVVQTAANVDKGWIGTSLRRRDGSRSCRARSRCSTTPTPPGWPRRGTAPAAGVDGLVIMVTFGTGIGIALINNGKLVPNAELGHIELDGHDAETKAAASARERDGPELGAVGQAGVASTCAHLENLLWPELFILGGGISKKPEKWVPLLQQPDADRWSPS